MKRRDAMGRREFIRKTSGAVAAGLGVSGALGGLACAASSEAIEEAAAKVGPLPRHKLGGTGREISVLAGAGTWAPEAVEAGILCGVNFWHKADEWRRVPQAILKNRDGHYCQICIDRVRGNHETGVLDEEEHVQLVKETLRQTGLKYFDDMQFHFGYHSVAELKSNRAFVRAFERLKKEGLVRHLCLSQHHYNGNRRVPGGQHASEILSAVIDDGVFEHAQFFYSYGDNGAMEEFLRKAKAKGFGTIAMKTTGGAGRLRRNEEFMKGLPAGTTPHQALARWLTTSAPLDSAIIEINNLSQFVETYSGAGKMLRAADRQALELLAAHAKREVCRLCNDCASHCPEGIAITDILRYERYALDYGEGERARRLYAQLDRQADACLACGTCLPHCSQGIQIAQKLSATHRLLG